MSKLVDEVAIMNTLQGALLAACKDVYGRHLTPEEAASNLYFLVTNHPETLERRRKDFEAGKSLARKRDMQRALSQHGMDGGSYISDQFDDYLTTEKGEK